MTNRAPRLAAQPHCRWCDDRPDSAPDIIEDTRNGVMICRKCGALVEPIIDERSEWRTFSDDTEDRSRVGFERDVFFEGKDQLETAISHKDGGTGRGRELSRIAYRNMASDKREMQEAFNEIQKFCSQISLPEFVIDEARMLYKKYGSQVKNTKAAIAGTIHLACRNRRQPRTMGDICRLTGVRLKDLGRAVKDMQRMFQEEHRKITSNAASTRVDNTGGAAKAEELAMRYCNLLRLDKPISLATVSLVKKAKELQLDCNKTPMSLAAAGTFLISQMSSQQKTLSEVAMVSQLAEATIRSAYKSLYPHANEIVPATFEAVRPLESLPIRNVEISSAAASPSGSDSNTGSPMAISSPTKQ